MRLPLKITSLLTNAFLLGFVTLLFVAIGFNLTNGNSVQNFKLFHGGDTDFKVFSNIVLHANTPDNTLYYIAVSIFALACVCFAFSAIMLLIKQKKGILVMDIFIKVLHIAIIIIFICLLVMSINSLKDIEGHVTLTKGTITLISLFGIAYPLIATIVYSVIALDNYKK